MKTSRRNWFKAAAGVAAGVGAASGAQLVPIKPELPVVLPDVVHYNGFTIKWTGWKYAQDVSHPCGQWIARPDDKQPIITAERPWGWDGIYSSFPGGVGFFNAGYVFDTCWHNQEWAIDHDRRWYEDPQKLVHAQRFALQNIKKFINEKI